MEEPKDNDNDSLNLIDTSSKKSQQDSNNNSQIKNNTKQKDLILEENDEEKDDEEDEKINDIENEINENEKLKNLMADMNEEEEEEEENENLNYDRHFDRELKVGKDYEYKTIQAAIDDAKPNNIIKISPGIYRENVIIKYYTKKDAASPHLSPLQIAISNQNALAASSGLT